MIVKTQAVAIEDMSDIYKGEDIFVEIYLDDIEYEIEQYAEAYLDMVKENDISLHVFHDTEILEHMKAVYGVVVKPFYYPNNSIRVSTAYEKLLDNADKIPIEEIERLIDKYNCL